MNADETKRPEDAFSANELAASLTVKDLLTSAAWYHEVVGFTIDRRYERDGRLFAVSLRAGQVRLLITQDDGTQGLDRAKGAGFSLQITTSQDIDALATRIQSRGGTLEAPPASMPWGPRVFRMRDPDGFRFTFSSPQAPAQSGSPGDG
jgi:uncharacterized glyoxalase superfamily protein PhnB